MTDDQIIRLLDSYKWHHCDSLTREAINHAISSIQRCAELERDVAAWGKAWDEMTKAVKGYEPMDVVLYGTFSPLISAIDTLDPRRKG